MKNSASQFRVQTRSISAASEAPRPQQTAVLPSMSDTWKGDLHVRLTAALQFFSRRGSRPQSRCAYPFSGLRFQAPEPGNFSWSTDTSSPFTGSSGRTPAFNFRSYHVPPRYMPTSPAFLRLHLPLKVRRPQSFEASFKSSSSECPFQIPHYTVIRQDRQFIL